MPKDPVFLRIPTKRIRPNLLQPRRIITQSAIDLMEASLLEIGQQTNAKVRPLTEVERLADPDHDYELIGGHIRHAGALKAGLATLDCMVLDLTPEQAKVAAILDNVSLQMNWLEMAEACESLLQTMPKPTQAAVGKMVGIEQEDVSKKLAVLRVLTPASRQLIYAKSIKVFGGELIPQNVVATLTTLGDPQKVESALNMAIDNKMTEPKAKGLVKWIQAGNPPETYTGQKAATTPKTKKTPGITPEALDKAVEMAEQVGLAKGRGEDPKPYQDQLNAYLTEVKTASPKTGISTLLGSQPAQSFKITDPKGFGLLKQKIKNFHQAVFKPDTDTSISPPRHQDTKDDPNISSNQNKPSHLSHPSQKQSKIVHWFIKLGEKIAKQAWHRFFKYEHRFCKEIAKEAVPEHHTLHSGHRGAKRGFLKDATTFALTLLHWAVYGVCQFVFWWAVTMGLVSRFVPFLRPRFEWPFRFAARQVFVDFPAWAWAYAPGHLLMAVGVIILVFWLSSLAYKVEPMRMWILGIGLAAGLYYGHRWANQPSPWAQTTDAVSTPVLTPNANGLNNVPLAQPKRVARHEAPQQAPPAKPAAVYQPSISFNAPVSPSDLSPTGGSSGVLTTLYDPKLLEQEIAALPPNAFVKAYPVLPDEGMPWDMAVSRLQDLIDPDKYTMWIGSGKEKITFITPSNTNLIIAYKSTDPFDIWGSSGPLNIFWEDVLYILTDEIDVADKNSINKTYLLNLVSSTSRIALTIQCATPADMNHLVSTLEYFVRHSRLGHDTALAGLPYPHQGLLLKGDGLVSVMWANSVADKAGLGLGDHLWSVGKKTPEQQSKKELEAGLSVLPATIFAASPSEWDKAQTAARQPGLSNSMRPVLRKIILGDEK